MRNAMNKCDALRKGLCGSLLYLLLVSPADSEVVSRVVAEVNGEIITSQELEQIIRPVFAKYKRAYSGEELERKMEQARKDAVAQLIERKLVLLEAKKQSILIDERDVEKRFSQIRSKFDSEDEFYYALEREGISADQLRENIREQILVRQLTRKEVTRSVSVSPREITDYYNKNIARYSEPERVQVGQILIKKGNDKQDARRKIELALQKISEGVPFEIAAKEYSEGPYAKDGGNMPFFGKGELMKELEDAIRTMEVGQKSGIIESALGYHIIVLKAKKKPRVQPLSEVWVQIEDELYQEKASAIHKQWVEGLKKKAHVRIY